MAWGFIRLSRFGLAGAGRSLQEGVRGAADEVSYEL